MKAGQIGIELRLGFEIDIKTKQIQEGQLEILRRRIIGIRHQAFRVLLLCSTVKTLDELLNLAMAMPANQ